MYFVFHETPLTRRAKQGYYAIVGTVNILRGEGRVDAAERHRGRKYTALSFPSPGLPFRRKPRPEI